MARIQNMKSLDRLKHWEEFMTSINMNESTSTQDSRLTPRENLLQAKGQEYESHKKSLRIQQVKDQLSKSPFKPKIHSKFDSKEKVENRLIRFGQVSESKLEKIRREKMKNEEKLSKLPSKNIENKNLAERLLNKQKLVEKKIENQRQEKIQNEEDLMKSPEICKKSQKIVENMKRTEKVEDRLFNSAKNFHEKVKAQQFLSNYSNFCSSKPQITDYAKNLNRKGDISERLLRYKQYYDGHLKELEQKYHSNPSTSPKRSNSTARERLLKPKSPSRSPEPHSFTPSISPYSQKLVKNLEKSSERLLKPSQSQSKPFEEPDCYFRPIINENSKKFDNRKNHEGERWESLYSLKEMVKENREKLVCSFNSPDPECTFKPIVRTQREPADQLALISRLNGWKNEVEGKVAMQRKRLIEDELRQCTFSPEIGNNSGFLEISPRCNVKSNKYSKKYQEVSAGEFLSKLEELHLKLHSDS